MAKMTLLEMTQDILNDMDSDPVNAIGDTDESEQIAVIIRTTYFNIIAQRDWPFLRTLIEFNDAASATPTTIAIDENTNKIHWIKYNKKDVTYLTPKEFRDKIDARPASTGVYDADGFINDSDPSYWTTYDDQNIIFDAYDSAVVAYLEGAKTVAFATQVATWTHTDAFTPSLPEKMFTTLLATAKSTSFSVLKQIANSDAAAIGTRGIIRAQNEAWKTKDSESKSNRINYGRK